VSLGTAADGVAPWAPGGNDPIPFDEEHAQVAWYLSEAGDGGWRDGATVTMPWRAIAAILPERRRRQDGRAEETGGYRP
jgi:hypothetical protein